ncbi:AfsR/SARP family transcriptional regulator [Streptomyces sp. NPDC050095]|uniref:AfsR/SARP family transcriptional regulator n=1 Tax=unclassified Streptomyces TaxID=2593676 RepID=UPI003447A72E
MRFELLGTLRLLDGERSTFISAHKLELLLATLLIRADHVVTTDQLMGEIWGDRLPKRATAGLHVYVSELRKLLHRAGRPDAPIVTRSPGYMLLLRDDEVDAEVFLELTERGREFMRSGQYEQARAAFEEALALWRGPVLGDIGLGPVVRSFATRLTETRTDCMEMLVDAQLRLGRHRELVGLLYTLIAENPLREAFHRQLMLALYRSERQADALKAYQSARKTLIDELGLEPCAPLQDLHRAILQADPRALDLCATAA